MQPDSTLRFPETFRPCARPIGRRYCLITPCRDEAQFIRTTLDTVCAQTLLPALWVIVDDGSTDATPSILAEYAARHDFIKIVTRADRGGRAVGPGVVEAFYYGLMRVNLREVDFIVKFDGDLEMPPRYFERVMERMEADPYLGNLSGKLYERHGERGLVEDPTGDENAVGPAKLYRTECFEDIGGFVREVAWDGIDGHVCRLNGWIALSVDDPEMRIIHLRPMGSSQQGIRVGRLRWGRGKYFMGSAWYFILASALSRLMHPPRIVGAIGILSGYVKAWWSGHPRYENPAYRAYLRRFERVQLFVGKRRAIERESLRIRAAGPPRLRPRPPTPSP